MYSNYQKYDIKFIKEKNLCNIDSRIKCINEYLKYQNVHPLPKKNISTKKKIRANIHHEKKMNEY
jgi:hypothetical protein